MAVSQSLFSSDDTPSSQGLSWAAARLRLGQANVGFWVVVASGVIALQPALPELGGALQWVGLVIGFAVVQAPFDCVGGYALPVKHGRRAPGVGMWARTWLRGVILHALAYVLAGWVALAVANVAGVGAAGAVLVLLAFGMVVGQRGVALGLAGASIEPPPESSLAALSRSGVDAARVDVVDVDDAGFVGGWVGLPGRERLLLPRRWVDTLTAPNLEIVLLRRRLGLESGARIQGVMGAVAFNATGLVLALCWIPGSGLDTASGLWVTSAGVTLWSFLGLLTLPSLSRRAVHHLDRMTQLRRSPEGVARVIRTLDRDQEDESTRSRLVETFFHPVPAPEHRVDALAHADMGAVAPWRITRMALYTSWMTLSWLSRAVHCNGGRPQLWAMLPGD
jgi:hypothetical protein